MLRSTDETLVSLVGDDEGRYTAEKENKTQGPVHFSTRANPVPVGIIHFEWKNALGGRKWIEELDAIDGHRIEKRVRGITRYETDVEILVHERERQSRRCEKRDRDESVRDRAVAESPFDSQRDEWDEFAGCARRGVDVGQQRGEGNHPCVQRIQRDSCRREEEQVDKLRECYVGRTGHRRCSVAASEGRTGSERFIF